MKKMKTRSKGKAVMGISLATIMVVSVLAAAMPMVSAYSDGGNFNIIEGAGTQKVLIGQNLEFRGYGAEVTISRIVSGDVENVYQTDAQSRIYNVNWPTTGAFFVNYDTAAGSGAAQLSIEEPDVPLELKVGTKAVSSIAEGTPLKVYTGGINLFDEDRVDLVIIGPDGRIKTDTGNNQDFTNITVEELKTYGEELITDGWKIGDYTFQVESKSANACGLDISSTEKQLKILKGEISIDAEPTSVMELDTVTVTITGVAGDNIRVAADPCKDAAFIDGVDDTPTSGCSFEDTIDSDGIRKYAIEFNDTGTYTLRATVLDGLRVDSYDTVDITVLEKAVEFDMPNTAIIGERITIKGTATSGTYVSVWIDDTLFSPMRNLVLEDGEFSKEVTTTAVGMTVPGSVRLKAWIDVPQKQADDAPPTRTADGEAALLLQVPALSAELSTPSVAVKDDFRIDGYAPGSTNVWIMAVPPKGGGGKSLTEERKGIVIDKASVATTDNTFTKKLTVQKDATSGYYDLYVLSSGMDNVWDMTNETNLIAAINEKYHIADITDPDAAGTKTQTEVKSMLEDMVTTAGSDDLMVALRLKVESAYVRLDPIAGVSAGTPLVVKGASNRQQGFNIVVTCKGPVELEPEVVKIENDTFTATFDTTDALTGEYIVKADDGDGHTDEVEVFITGKGAEEIREKVTEVAEVVEEGLEELLATPVPTPAPTPEPTATPEPTPEPPGFEAIFAIAGLLAVAYLVHRRKN